MTTQLQKAYAELSQAGAMVVANEMTTDFHKSKALKQHTFTSKYLKLSGDRDFAETYSLVDKPNAKYDLIKEGCGYSTEVCDCGSTKSGAAVCIGVWGSGILDINGSKGPNTVGIDAFNIGFANDGTLDPGYDQALKKIVDANWDIEAYH